MQKPALLILLSALCLGGCFNIVKPKPIAGAVEESFKNRWLAKRTNELQTTGKASSPEEAKAIAVEEFKKKFEYGPVTSKIDAEGNTRK